MAVIYTIPKTEESAEANPKKLKKPTISVTVVNMIEDDVAGSCPIAFKPIGIIAPAKPAIIIDMTIEMAITIPIPIEDVQK